MTAPKPDRSVSFSKDLEQGDHSLGTSDRKPDLLKRRTTLKLCDPTHNEFDDETYQKGFQIDRLMIEDKEITKVLRSHQEFQVRAGYKMKNLPKFDDLTRYGISECEEMNLWQLEVERLTKAAKDDGPPELAGHPDWYGKPDPLGYNCLHQLASQLFYATQVCVHNNELIIIEHQPDLAREDFKEAHRSITKVFDPVALSMRYDRVLSVGEHNFDLYHALVDYVTATLIRLLIRTMYGGFWVENSISILAKFAAKFKVVGADLPRAFERTLDAHKEFLLRISHPKEAYGVFSTIPLSTPAPDGADLAKKQQAASQEDLALAADKYFLQMTSLRHPLRVMLLGIASDLMRNESIGKSTDLFESSSIVYDTGFPEQRTHLSNTLHEGIGASGQRRDVDLAVLAFQLAAQTWEEMQTKAIQMGGTKNGNVENPEYYTTIEWTKRHLPPPQEMTNASKSRSPIPSLSSVRDTSPSATGGTDEWDMRVKVYQMKDTIKALVPYLMYSGITPSVLALTTTMAKLIADSPQPLQYYKQECLLTAAKMKTSVSGGIETLKSKSLLYPHETEMARCIQSQVAYNDIEDQVTQVTSWDIAEKTITIPHKWYSAITLLVCSLVIGGGVVFIALGDRVNAVDPSNLTTLSWAAAGFILVWFQSQRVQDWPWRDFLRGRIVCRSVTEVVSVTRMHPQTFMAILLRYQKRFGLTTSGPHNSLFEKKAEDGFSIDVPQLTRTAVDGGTIFVAVDSDSGPALVALPANNWTKFSRVTPTSACKENQRLICKDFLSPRMYPLEKADPDHQKTENDEDKMNDGKDQVPLYPICSEEFHWFGVRGIYAGNACYD